MTSRSERIEEPVHRTNWPMMRPAGALLAHTRKGVTAVYERWDKFDLRREMGDGRRAVATRNIGRRTDDGDQGRRIRRQSPKQHDERAAMRRPFSLAMLYLTNPPRIKAWAP